MVKLLTNRWLRWTLLAIALSGLGVGIYRFTPPEPMCVIEIGTIDWRFMNGSNELVIWQVEHTEEDVQLGRLQVRNARTGEIVARYFQTSDSFRTWAFSNNGRYFAAEVLRKAPLKEPNAIATASVFLVDLALGKIHEIASPTTSSDGTLLFSESGQTLMRQSRPLPLQLFDSDSRSLLDERETTGLVEHEGFTDELLVHYARTRMGYRSIEIWNPRERKLIRTFKEVGQRNIRVAMGQFLMYTQWKPSTSEFDKYVLWNLRTDRLAAEFQTDEMLRSIESITPDGRFVVSDGEVPNNDERTFLTVRELATGKQVSRIEVDALAQRYLSPNGRFLAISSALMGEGIEPSIQMLEIPTLKPLWKKYSVGFGRKYPFADDANLVLSSATGEMSACAYGCATGELRAQISFWGNSNRNLGIHLTPDRKTILLTQSANGDNPPFWIRWLEWLPGLKDAPPNNDAIVVFDMNTFRERLRLRSWKAQQATLSNDGRTLITEHGSHDDVPRTLRCWDVDAWKPLHWALGVPTGLAAVIGLFGWWRGRRQVKVA